MTENKRFTITGVGISDHKKKRLYDLQTIDGFISVRDELNALHEENLSIRASATLYKNIFHELQKQLNGVKKASDLDSKDFEDLIELSKGNVFDDKLGWIHLPVKELQE